MEELKALRNITRGFCEMKK